ncbi:MAG: 2-oxoglutarate ferredoxin oxidoreductase subunit delta [Actinomycetota bacterium]|nr:2-oxoglutarate ferredoxin oxidoreductase subunit delta [Actinomycetota bacterium]
MSEHMGMSEQSTSGTTIDIKSRGTVTIDAAHCKGCDLCIPACPPGVLAMSTEVNHMGYRFPQLSPGCTGCGACLYVCPDFVFEVYRYEEPVITTVPRESAEVAR